MVRDHSAKVEFGLFRRSAPKPEIPMRLRTILLRWLCPGILLALVVGRVDAVDLEGTWWGEALVPGGGVFIQLDGSGSEAADTTPNDVSISIPKLGLFGGRPRSMVSGEDGFTIVAAGSGVAVEIELQSPTSRDARSISASLTFIEGPSQVTDLGRFEFVMRQQPPVRRLPGAVRHDGMLDLPGGGILPITVVFGEKDGTRYGLIDIPAQGVQGLVLLPVGLVAPKVEPQDAAPIESYPDARGWRIPVPMEASLVVRPEGDSLLGRFRQGPLTLDVEFQRATGTKVLTSRRPQDPMAPFPYREIEVEVPAPAGHVLAGTLLVPAGGAEPAGFPAVVLVSGSGQQNRDQELFGHRPFRLLADRLARVGIASLRFDDRGMAGSTGDFAQATTLDLASDAAAVLMAMEARPEIDGRRCGIIGHSEGGAIAAIIAAGMAPGFPRVPVSFLVSIAGTGVDGGVVLADQLPRIYRAQGMTDASITFISEAQKSLLDLIRDPEAFPEATADAFRELQRRQMQVQGLEIDEDTRLALEAAGINQMKSPWMTTFVRFDPAEAWRKVEVPVLAINGTLDTQVSPDLNLGAIESAIEEGGGEIEIMRLEGLNHMLQPAKTGGVDEYALIDVTMDEQSLVKITAWLRKIVANPDAPITGAP